MAVYNSSYGHPKRAIYYTNVYCHGHEELGDCTHHTLEFEVGQTYKAEVAGVDCRGSLKCIFHRLLSIAQSNCSLVLFVNCYFYQ